ncbi:radical SAM protein [Chloroflexota bacterium]
MNQGIYLYVNVPFCLKRCRYCYCTLMFLEDDLLAYKKKSDDFVDALVKEIATFDGKGRNCKGISFGGGSPSLLTVPQIERILNALKQCCGSYDMETQMSMEVFPGTKTRDELKAIRTMGFNRASLGAQSFDDKELEFFDRAHDVKTFYQSYEDLIAAGFDNINIDLLFGLPVEKPSNWKKSVDAALMLQPKHLTAYYWYPTRGNYFYNKITEGSLQAPGRETSIEQYQYAIDAAAKAGLNRYWDFNFSREFEYQYAIERDSFRFCPLKGFGPGAWSQEGNNLICNSSMLYSYFKNPLKRHEQKCSIEYYLLRVLMFPQGLVFEEFERYFNKKWSLELLNDKVKKAFDVWIENDFFEINSTGIRFREETIARSSIYLAELQTKLFYMLEDGDLP